MMNRTMRGVLGVVCAFGIGTAAMASSPQELFDQGTELLVQAKFEAALQAFAEAAKADPENQAYRQQFAVLRRVMQMREGIADETDSEKWESSAQALRVFYYANGIPAEALSLDRKRHADGPTPASAELLGETLLEAGRDSEAAGVLTEVPADQRTPRGTALLAVALVRQGSADEAAELLRDATLPEKPDPDLCYALARAFALVDDADEAAARLTSCFEHTPPSQLEDAKTRAKKCPDLRSLVASAGFEKCLATESKVKESGCSSGSSCAKCPSRGKCSSGTGK